MDVKKTSIEGLVVVKPKIFGDDRGFFTELFKTTTWESLGLPMDFVQDNLSQSAKGTLRGLHYQNPPHAQGKLVYCLSGRIYDVGVDLRKDSPTYGKWEAEILDAKTPMALYVPAGFAHGFQALEEGTRVFYKCTGSVYDKGAEGGVRFDDPDLGIPWPLENPILAPRDLELPSFKEFEKTNVFTL